MSLLRPGSGPHPIVPRDLLTSTQNQGANFLTFPPDVVSGEDHLVYYFAVVKSFGPEEKTVVVKTLKGCEVTCHTEGCQGQERLCEGGLVQICHHKSGDKEGKTFVSNASGELTPTTSHAGSKVGSRAGSRAPSRQPSRPPSPVEG
ncbi:hypothetical protein IMSHALPRED_008926 [Imshaugia aleurites]|uniref:Uncharacterized protein n=1 Tax=Imshaugia aleurites TaxID=172621 RepID=A0A8H3G3P4_9LECA|nr:hypothetical protein IMSHALPRED_008926 [Imshaugia aleurites]